MGIIRETARLTRSDEYIRALLMTEDEQDALEVSLDAWLPGWEQDERRAYGLVLGERDFSMTDDSPEWLDIECDWQAWIEDNYSDPTERMI